MSGLKKDMGAVQKAIQMLAGTYDKDVITLEVAQITAVDTANWLCTAQLVSGTAQNILTNIQLTAELASNGFVQVPRVGSNVILVTTFRNEVYIFMCSEIDALVFHQLNSDGSYEEFVINCNSGTKLPLGIHLIDGAGNGVAITSGKVDVSSATDQIFISNPHSSVTLTDSLIQLNDGNSGGLVKVIDLTTKLNNLENDLNNLKSYLTILSSALSAASTSPLTGGSLASAMGAILTSYPTALFTPTQRDDIENKDITHGKKK